MKREFTLLNEVVVSETKEEFSSDSDSQIQNCPSGRRPGPLLVSLASLESLPACRQHCSPAETRDSRETLVWFLKQLNGCSFYFAPEVCESSISISSVFPAQASSYKIWHQARNSSLEGCSREERLLPACQEKDTPGPVAAPGNSNHSRGPGRGASAQQSCQQAPGSPSPSSYCHESLTQGWELHSAACSIYLRTGKSENFIAISRDGVVRALKVFRCQKGAADV